LPNIERVEMERHHKAMVADVRKLVEKYRAIFDWDVPDIDQVRADRLILEVMHRALADLERALVSRSQT